MPLASRVVRWAGEQQDALERVLRSGSCQAAPRVVLFTGNLNAHCTSSLQEAFAPAGARWLAERIEWPRSS